MANNGTTTLNNTSNTLLRDYQHAARLFGVPGNFQNVPRVKFLFHVYFNLNSAVTSVNKYTTDTLTTIGMLVKTIQLPTFKLETEVLNQYNRKRVIQKKISYDPVQVEMHDDSANNIRDLWYNYYSYYYKDPTQKYGNSANQNGTNGQNPSRSAGFDYNTRDIYANDRFVNDWGYSGESYSDNNSSSDGKPAFFKDITVYGFNQHQFVQYVLINPMISDWKHDTYNYSEDNGIMQNTMTIQYEAVKYYQGVIGQERPDTNVQGFAQPGLYDQTASPYMTPNGKSSYVSNTGQYINAGQGQVSDTQATLTVNSVGGVQQADVAYNVNNNNTRQAVPDPNTYNATTTALQNSLPGQLRSQPGASGTGISIPTPGAEVQTLANNINGVVPAPPVDTAAAFGIHTRRKAP